MRARESAAGVLYISANVPRGMRLRATVPVPCPLCAQLDLETEHFGVTLQPNECAASLWRAPASRHAEARLATVAGCSVSAPAAPQACCNRYTVRCVPRPAASLAKKETTNCVNK